MFNRSLRRAALIVALPAFMAGATAAPALASSRYDDDKKKEVTVKICKEVKDDDYKKDKKDDKTKFEIKVWTDEKDKKVKLRDGDCKEFDLKYDDYKKVYVEESYTKGYKFVKLACYDGYGKHYASNYNKSCDVKKDYVKIVVVNEKKDDKKH